ncbi:MAG: hypothetical protein EAX96_06865 [Candidatus Lokiarchaeota archaeon]|nr:hypothetical protein [Candidatus Lokiarchaeota archaeon]
MSYQYYNTLLDKSKERILYLLDQISPKLNNNELKIILSDLNDDSKTKKTKQTKEKNNDITIFSGQIDKKDTDYSKLSDQEIEILYKTFISKELSDKNAVKWRFYQNLKIIKEIIIKEIKFNPFSNLEDLIDFSISTEDDQILFVSCYDILDLDQYNSNISKIKEFLNKTPKNINSLIFATNRVYRNVPLDEIVVIGEAIIVPEIWVEWIEDKRPFNSDDLLIINDEDLTVAAYNFTGMQDLLNYVYKMSEGGQISIYKSIGYFSEYSQEESELELIWKGIMLKGVV